MQTIKTLALNKMYKLTSGTKEKEPETPVAAKETNMEALTPNSVEVALNDLLDDAELPQLEEVDEALKTGPAPPLPSKADRAKYLSIKRRRLPDSDNDGTPKRRAKKSAHKHCIQKTTIKAIIKEIIGNDMTVSAEAERILHQVSENELTTMFENAEILSKLNGRKTVSLSDIRGVLALKATSFAEKKKILLKDQAFDKSIVDKKQMSASVSSGQDSESLKSSEHDSEHESEASSEEEEVEEVEQMTNE